MEYVPVGCRRDLLITCFVLLTLSWAAEPIRLSGSEAPDNGEAQSARSSTNQAARDRGMVRGRVTDSFTGQPVSGAEVLLSTAPAAGSATRAGVARPRGSSSSVLTQTTGPNGRFVFNGVLPGRYELEVVAPGFIRGHYGRDQTLQAPLAVNVRGGDAANLDVALVRAGVVSGRILAGPGRGIGGIAVELLRETYGRAGPTVGTAAAGVTQKDGTFRIADVRTGEYYVLAYRRSPGTPSTPGAADAYAPTLYPGVARLDSAQRLFIGPGQELVDLEITLATVRTYGMTGRVMHPDGSPVKGTLQVTPIGALGERANLTRAVLTSLGPDGRFDIRNLVPGNYLVIADGAIASIGWRGPLQAQLLSVNANIEDLEIVVDQPARLEGRVATANGELPPFSLGGLSIGTQQRWEGGIYSPTAPGSVAADGTFAIHSPAREVWLHVRNLPAPWIVESVRLNGVLVTDEPFTLAGGSFHRIDIAVTNRSGRLAGRVTDDDGAPGRDGIVLLFPQDRSLWGVERRTHRAVSQEGGAFAFDRLPPGDYRAIAMRALAPNVPSSPEALDLLWPSSVPVRIAEGAAVNTSLAIASGPLALMEP